MNDMVPTGDVHSRVLASLHSMRAVSGFTHNFYRYPARMSPELAREVIHQFTQPGEYIVDPFMGGGTSIIEAVAAGRRAVGVDLNPLAQFVATAKTTPLSDADRLAIRRWVNGFDVSSVGERPAPAMEPRTKNMPDEVFAFLARLIEDVDLLIVPRQRRFLQCAFLRLGQWAVDCKNIFPTAVAMREQLYIFVEDMFAGLDDFVRAATANGIAKNKITGQRELILRSTVGLEDAGRVQKIKGKPTLVITSPPYPGVHVLYHRWQVSGRRETPAPYWLIDANDGYGASHYTFGSRDTSLGLQNYFRILTEAFQSVRAIVHPEALVVQLVAFSDVSTQLPAFLDAMKSAGYREDAPISTDRTYLWRSIPNRKWYNYIGAARSGTKELLLFHRPYFGINQDLGPVVIDASSSTAKDNRVIDDIE